MKKITTFLLSTVFLSKTLASKAQHRVVRIALFLIIFSCFSSYSIAGIREKQDIPKMVQRADLIIRGKVISTESQWKEDSRGRHIYTNVTVKILDKIKGDIKDDAFAFEVVGGTVDDIREVVSGTPVFEIDEEAIVFLAGHPLAIQHGTNGKILIYDGRVYRDDLEVTVDSFIQSLKILEQDPGAMIPLGEKYQAPTAEAADVPIITDISFDEAPAVTNKQVTITGTNFGSTQGFSKVKFFNKSRQQKIPASIVSWSNTQIICTVPANISAGSSPITVTTSDGTSSSYVIAAADCYIYSGIKWPGASPTVYYKINENTSDCTGEGAAVQSAASTWNNVGANFTFQYGGSHTRTVSSGNNINEILWGTSLPNGILARTYYWYYPGEMDECDIVFNDLYYNWDTTPSSSEIDVESVALHEFGHWLQLDDLYDYADRYEVMYYELAAGEVKRILRECDCDGICYIYGGSNCGCVNPPVRLCYECEPEDEYLGTIGTSPWYSISGNCGNGGKWVGQFVGEAGATYHFDLCPDSPGSGIANFDADIKITNSSCSILDGEDGYCISSSYSDYLPNDFQWNCISSGSYYVIIAPYNSYNSHTCEGDASDTFTLKYYKGGCSPPTPPTGVSASDGTYCDRICVSWNSVSGATGYEIWRNTSNNSGSASKIADDSSSPYCDYDVDTGTTYYYWVKAKNSCGTSGFSSSDTGWLPTPPEAQDGSVTTSVDTPVTITLQATDEGCPDPPGALTYIIMSLPIHGNLNEPGSGWIDSVPYILVGYGNEVEYIPDTGYEGQDSFTFIANDDGAWPGGGDSNEATVSIDVRACIFFDDFPSTTLDTYNWPETSGTPTVDDLANNEPSAPYSLHFEYTDTVISRAIDLSGASSAQLVYYWQRYSTETGDDLYVDYWDGDMWQPLRTHLHNEGSTADFTEEPPVDLPVAALHTGFRVRFQASCSSSSDEWYIDDICIQRQCGIPGDFEPDCDVDFDDLAVLCDQWLLAELSADVAPIDEGDNFVDFFDWAVFANAWQSTPSSPNWNPKCDIAPEEGDDIVDIGDLAVFMYQWLQLFPYRADIAPVPDGDGRVDLFDFAVFAENWLEGKI